MGNRLKLVIPLLQNELPFLFVISVFIVLSFFEISLALETSLIMFLAIASVRLIELVPLTKSFSLEHRKAVSELRVEIKRIIKFYSIFPGLLTAFVVSIWQLGLTGITVVSISAAWLIFVVILFQMLSWYMMLSDAVNEELKSLQLPLFFGISIVMAGGTAWIAFMTGVPAFLDFTIVFGGFGISYCIFYNYIGYLWFKPDWLIRSDCELNERIVKLRDMKRNFANLMSNLYPQVRKVKATNIIVSEKSSKYFMGVDGEKTKFYDMENKKEITDQENIKKLSMAMSLKNNLNIILSPSIQKKIFWDRIAFLLFYTRLAPNYKIMMKNFMSNPESEIHRYCATVFSEIRQGFSLRISRIKNMLMLFSEVPSIELAKEICEEAENVRANSDKILNIFKEGSVIWEKRFGKWSRIFLLSPEEARKSVEKKFKWLSLISDACKTSL